MTRWFVYIVPEVGGKAEKVVNVINATTTMYVPSTCGGLLLKRIKMVEEKYQVNSSWRPKLLEKAGLPLVNIFRTKIPITSGCPLGEMCRICDSVAV